MYDDNSRGEEIGRAARRLEDFLRTLGASDLDRQSACEGWTLGDVVGHLVERGGPIPDQIERGLKGTCHPLRALLQRRRPAKTSFGST